MVELTLNESRALGVLIEKAVTTPDQYPLSLNALTTGCNQKTNRNPVLDLEESEVQDAIDALIKKNLVSEVRFGGRVPKYQHRFSGTEFSEYRFTKQETGILCLLFLRGSQTPGELRTRSNRLCTFADVAEVESVLKELEERAGGPFVACLPREPGRRESRYMHLFSGDEPEIADDSPMQSSPAQVAAASETAINSDLEERVELLELTVEELQSTVARLQDQLDQLLS